MKYARFAVIGAVVLLGLSAAAGEAAELWSSLASPDGMFRIEFSVGDKGKPLYRVRRGEDEVILPSGLGFVEAGGEDWTGGYVKAELGEAELHDGSWRPVWGERSLVRDHYRGAVVLFRRPGPIAGLKLEVRAYDSGVAFRYLVGTRGEKKSINIESEKTEFCFTADHKTWAVYSAQGKYSKVKLSELRSSVERPCVLETEAGKVIAIAEAA
ncbi:MAG: glycoside hydrolase family 97 N-terminal domain-containing protein, partial [Planctomycetota bacterium]|nr:glycoside hydrolase family 97 N-terminal domain-containing protein [Planctomycetota bacterium]